ncbi:MAG TPA: ATP-binding protein [Vicinamibacteria bacterium]|nr:ATP-binding protein [Vicinamibacteria bacterium]
MDDREERDRMKASYEDRVRTLADTVFQRERELTILAHVASRVHGENEVQAILDIALDEILERMDLETAWIFMGTDDERKLTLAASRGVSQRYLEEIRIDGLGECLCPEVFWSGHRMQARNTTQCPRMPDIVEGLSAPVAHACIPLRFDQQTRGVLNVAARPGQLFTEDELRFLETLGHQIGLAVERARHYQELREAQARSLRSEKMAVLGTFASGLAHEVRNPLNSIALQLSILDRRIGRCEPALGKEMADLSGVIREEVKRLDGLVGDFLLFSRVDRIQYQSADLEQLIDEVVRLLRPEALAAGVAIQRRRGAEPIPPARMDGEKMKQVVMNLVRNAVEATPEGGTVTLESGLVDGRARLVVRDTGPGLPAGVDVFQLFVTTKPKGTGLGLSIVQQIVLQHGGEIVAASEPGRGACFTVTLPVQPVSEAQTEARS